MPETTTRIGIERERAKFAYECAQKIVSEEKKEFQKEYKSYVKKIPMMIKTNGVGATFAFVLSKAKEGSPYQHIYNQTAEWLQQDPKKLITLTKTKELAGQLVALESPQYRALTFEILAFFNWLRRFADGLIEDEIIVEGEKP